MKTLLDAIEAANKRNERRSAEVKQLEADHREDIKNMTEGFFNSFGLYPTVITVETYPLNFTDGEGYATFDMTDGRRVTFCVSWRKNHTSALRIKNGICDKCGGILWSNPYYDASFEDIGDMVNEPSMPYHECPDKDGE